ncbi:uncharacterized protein LOC142349767 isoform X3 [Convolutriloba macropyga]|uniref:uncharacterized protein LOC142349767 isoform X3 n=1 Tax=Convolutriloba macropyga TaxID=536237 RepID=UPI003F5202D0
MSTPGNAVVGTATGGDSVVLSIIKYGEPKCVSSGTAPAARSSLFTHPRELDDPSSHPLARSTGFHVSLGDVPLRRSRPGDTRRLCRLSGSCWLT